MHIWPLDAFNLTDVKFELHVYTIFISFSIKWWLLMWNAVAKSNRIVFRERIFTISYILISIHDTFQVVNINSAGFDWISTTGIVSNILKNQLDQTRYRFSSITSVCINDIK